MINVAYGKATVRWARRYRVDDHLRFDADGSAVVKPFGNNTFTTMVLSPTGEVLFTGRPGKGNFVAAVEEALGR